MTQQGMTTAEHESRVHAGEWTAAILSFIYFFCVLCAYYVVRPVREQFSAAVGSTNLPWFYLATFIATLALTPAFAWLSARYARHVVVPVVYLFFIACLVGFIPLFTSEGLITPKHLGTMFFVWVSVFNLFVVSVFWTFMTDIWNPEQSKRLFPLIAIGGTAGTVVGPVLTRMLVDRIGVAPLLAVSASLLVLSILCVLQLSKWKARTLHPDQVPARTQGVGGGMFDGLKQIFANPFVGGMAILLLLGDGIGTVNYALVADYTGVQFTDPKLRTIFAANTDLVTNVLIILTQLFFTRAILMRWGAIPALLIWAIGAAASLLAVLIVKDPHAAISGATVADVAALKLQMGASWWGDVQIFLRQMPWVVMALIVSRALAYGMLGPAREAMFSAVPRNLRYQGKNAVDTAVWRFGDLAISTSMNGLRAMGMTVGGFAGLAALAGAAAALVGYRLGKRIERSPEYGGTLH